MVPETTSKKNINFLLPSIGLCTDSKKINYSIIFLSENPVNT